MTTYYLWAVPVSVSIGGFAYLFYQRGKRALEKPLTEAGIDMKDVKFSAKMFYPTSILPERFLGKKGYFKRWLRFEKELGMHESDPGDAVHKNYVKTALAEMTPQERLKKIIKRSKRNKYKISSLLFQGDFSEHCLTL
jgi:hypothetical protein